MTAPAWAHLPNAKHIDRILASLEAHPKKWDTARGGAYDAAHTAAWNAAYTAARSEAWDAARSAARSAARTAAYTAAYTVAYTVAWGAIVALVAWDDCAYMLDMPEDALKVLRAVGSQPAVLLSVAAKVLRAENI